VANIARQKSGQPPGGVLAIREFSFLARSQICADGLWTVDLDSLTLDRFRHARADLAFV
jgi:hypothetical protein